MLVDVVLDCIMVYEFVVQEYGCAPRVLSRGFIVVVGVVTIQ